MQSPDEDVAHSSGLSEPRRIELELVPIRIACGVVGSVFAVVARKKGDGDTPDGGLGSRVGQIRNVRDESPRRCGGSR
jgi:hypothetical protein